jgi:hypothetical protein
MRACGGVGGFACVYQTHKPSATLEIMWLRAILRECGVALISALFVGQGLASTINGSIVDPVQLPITNAEVVLRSNVAGVEPQHPRTQDFSGQFAFTGVAPGTYHLEISSPGFEKRTVGPFQVVEGEDIDTKMLRLALAPLPSCADELVVPDFRFSVSEGSELRGTVREMPGARLKAVTISLTETGGRNPIIAISNENGGFAFQGLKAGTYLLRASRAGYADFIIDSVPIRPGRRTLIGEPLELNRCPTATRCKPNKKVHMPVICL